MWRQIGFVCTVVALAGGTAAFGQTLANTPEDTGWRINGSFNRVMKIADDIAYLAGSFTYVGKHTGSAVFLDAATGTSATPAPGLEGYVYTVLADGFGGWYLGGSNFSVGGGPRTTVLHLLADGQPDPEWVPPVLGSVYALTLAGGSLFAAGYFGTTPRTALLALDPQTGEQRPWVPTIAGTGKAMLVLGDKLYLGGKITSAGGLVRAGGAAIDIHDGSIYDWNPRTAESLKSIDALAERDGRVLAGGDFALIGGGARSYLAYLDPETGDLDTPNPAITANGTVDQIQIDGDYLLLRGAFQTVSGYDRRNIALIYKNQLHPMTLPIADSQSVSSALMADGHLYVAVSNAPLAFDGVEAQLVRFPIALTAAQDWEVVADNAVKALASDGEHIAAAGTFTSVAGERRKYLAALDLANDTILDWNPAPEDWVLALDISGDTLYVGGWFESLAGQDRHALAAISRSTGALLDWAPPVDGNVRLIAAADDAVFVSGSFGTIGGKNRPGLAKLDAITGNATDWEFNYGPNALQWLVLEGDRLCVTENISDSDTERTRISVVGTSDDAPVYWSKELNNNWVGAIGMAQGAVYFQENRDDGPPGEPYRWSAYSALRGQPTAWSATSDNPAYGMVSLGKELAFFGVFDAVSGAPRHSFVALGTRSGADSGWVPERAYQNLAAAKSSAGLLTLNYANEIFLYRYLGTSETSDVSIATHSADIDGNRAISLSELLRAIQLYNSGGYTCAEYLFDTEDGYVPGLGDGNSDCPPHDLDDFPQDGRISLNELLRAIQFFNSGCYTPCPDDGSEDGFCVCAA